jgi:hypothetical protein
MSSDNNVQLDDDLFSDSKLDAVKTELEQRIDNTENPTGDKIDIPKPEGELLKSLMNKFKNIPANKRMEVMRMLRNMRNVNPENKTFDTVAPSKLVSTRERLKQKREELRNMRTNHQALEYRYKKEEEKNKEKEEVTEEKETLSKSKKKRLKEKLKKLQATQESSEVNQEETHSSSSQS